MKYIILNFFKLILLLSLICINSLTYAEAQSAFNLKGGFEVQTAFCDNSNTASNKLISGYTEDFGLNSSGHINVDFQDFIENSIEYGAKASLEVTSNNDRKVAAFIYTVSNFGKIELGSDKSATSKMRVTGYSAACGTGGGWDSWVTLPRDKTRLTYVTNHANFLDAKTRTSGKVEYSRKITYFTPVFYNFQIGVSYIPDSSNVGFKALNDEPECYKLASPLEHVFVIKDGIAYGVTYENQFNDDLKAKIAFVGEKGKIAAVFDIDKEKKKRIPVNDKKFKNLSTYTIGAQVDYTKFSFAAGYTNYMKSFTTIKEVNKHTKVYSFGAKYKYNDKLATSLNYFRSNHKKNLATAVTLALDYTLTSGVLSYIELSRYLTNGKYIDIETKDKTNGKLVVIGTKIEF